MTSIELFNFHKGKIVILPWYQVFGRLYLIENPKETLLRWAAENE